MSRLWSLLKGGLRTLGGLILYWATLLAFGIKPAIAVALAFLLVDGGRRLWRRRPLPPVWLAANGAALAFGLIDLWARTPFMIRYEAAIMNLGMGAVFAAGAFGRMPLVMRLARERSPEIPDRSEIVRYFRAFTVAWALYCVVRAAACLWIMDRWPLAQAIALRAAFGWISFGVMMLISLNGRWVFALCQRIGLFLPEEGR